MSITLYHEIILSFLSNINQVQLITAVTMAVSRDAPITDSLFI